MESIKKFGFVDPIIVNSAENRKNIVVGGHFRLKVARELGYKQAPVVYLNIPDLKKENRENGCPIFLISFLEGSYRCLPGKKDF